MTSIVYLKGDATKPHSGPTKRIIAHVCNDLGLWGAGFSGAISEQWSGPEVQYRLWHSGGKEDGFMLGEIQLVPVSFTTSVANMIAQSGIRRDRNDPPAIRYHSLELCLHKLSARALESRSTIHMPLIGAGLAGGSWGVIEKIISRKLCSLGISVTVYTL